MAHSTQTASSNGADARNLFCESEEHPAPAPTERSGGRRGRGRGLIVAIDEPAAAPSEAGAARFTRAPTGLNALPATARRRAARANRNAERLLERITARRHGALIALLAVAALLLAVSGLGLSLRAATSDRDHLRDQRATTSRALGAQRDRALQQATAAHAGQVRAQRSAQGWQARARREQRQLADARKAATRRKHER